MLKCKRCGVVFEESYAFLETHLLEHGFTWATMPKWHKDEFERDDKSKTCPQCGSNHVMFLFTVMVLCERCGWTLPALKAMP